MEKKDKKLAVINAAIKLFMEKGFDATSTASIAKEAGVATGTLFHYFKTKEELINSIYKETKAVWREETTKGFKEGEGIKEQTKRLFINSIDWALKRPEHYTFYKLFANSPQITDETRSEIEEHLGFMLQMVEAGQKQGIVKQGSAELIVSVGHGITNSVIEYLLQNPKKRQNRYFMETAFSMLWHSFEKK